MSGNSEKNSYELLDVPQGATVAQIEKAYLRARALYGEDSFNRRERVHFEADHRCLRNT